LGIDCRRNEANHRQSDHTERTKDGLEVPAQTVLVTPMKRHERDEDGKNVDHDTKRAEAPENEGLKEQQCSPEAAP
jgi:hypothetical protein